MLYLHHSHRTQSIQLKRLGWFASVFCMEDRGPSIKRVTCGTCHHQNTQEYNKIGCLRRELSTPKLELVFKPFANLHTPAHH